MFRFRLSGFRFRVRWEVLGGPLGYIVFSCIECQGIVLSNVASDALQISDQGVYADAFLSMPAYARQ